MAKAKKREYTIVLHETLPSLNKLYEQGHWSKRKRLADYWHMRVEQAVHKTRDDISTCTLPVRIEITCFFENKVKALDPDNIAGKLAIDALKGVVITDDNYKFVRSVTQRSRLDRANPRTVIEIKEI